MLPAYYHIKVCNGVIQFISETDDKCSVIDIEGKKTTYKYCKVLPSFVDSHCHFHGLGMILNGLLLNSCKSAEECAQLAYHSPAYRGDWIFGLGWNQSLWSNKEYPSREILDKLFPDKPVFLKRIDAHAAWLNSEALRRLNIDSKSYSPPGGEILKDRFGNPTGILIDEAMFQAEKKIPQFTFEQLKSQIETSQKELAKTGITEVHDMDFEPDFLEMFQHMEQNQDLYIKSKAYFRAQNQEYQSYNLDTNSNKYFKIVGVKFFMDGALGSHGAALFDKYKDANSKGILILDKDTLLDKIKRVADSNLHVAAHAIGDKAVHTVLSVYNKISDEYKNLHFRVEHVQIMRKEDIGLFKKENLVASLQPIHYYTDIDNILEDRLNRDQLQSAYLWNTFLESGIPVIAGSDFPIESHKPQKGILAFTRRLSPNGNIISAGEQLSLSNAIDAYTISPRKLFKEKVFTKGAQADFIIVNDYEKQSNPFFQIIATYSDGKVIHTA